ncbi:MAG: 50S ribosomal protein L2 [Puniceicoccales bacterium]|jgi:large subunit ribosomal protein L2|nr:50S ribosomal protein L2 [Puniceicoccales bacterium]
MLIQQKIPLTPGQRFLVRNKPELTNKSPEKRLLVHLHRPKGRNCYGRITSRRRGGGHKRLYRFVDFRRSKVDIPATVKAIEYDPNRSANLALLVYADGDKSYILAPENLKVGDRVISLNRKVTDYRPGMSFPLSCIPPATRIHSVEWVAGKGGQLARTAGSYVELLGAEGDYASVRMPSGEVRLLHVRCRATIGMVGNVDHQNRSLGKAGRSRWLGRRPRVRGGAMNPVDHPMGGGHTGGGNHPMSPWAQLSKGSPTRKRSKSTDAFILVRRNGRKVKKG